MIDAKALLEKRRMVFAAKRRDIEVWVENFYKQVDSITPKLLEGTHPPVGRTPQELFPSMYKEPFVQEDFDKEYEVVDAYYNEVQAIAEGINNKATEVLEQCNSV